MKLDIKEIAKKAGVSVATISRAMDPETRKKVALSTLKKIDTLIRKYSYVPNIAARNLRKSSTKVIGVIFPYVPNIFFTAYFTHILAGVSNFLFDTDYRFKLLLLRDDKAKWSRYNFKRGEGVDGLIVTQWFRFFSKKFISEEMGIPYVVINDFDKNLKARFVCGDHFNGGEIVAEYLYSFGHRRFAVITGPSWSMDSKQRVEGFSSYLNRKGVSLESDLILTGDYDDYRKTYQRVDELLQKRTKITAIFCCNDYIAFAAIRRLQELGISCPAEISVIGYDNESESPSFSPPLTTIHVPVYDLAKEAARCLVDYLKPPIFSKKSFIGRTWIPVHIVERGSVSKVKKMTK